MARVGDLRSEQFVRSLAATAGRGPAAGKSARGRLAAMVFWSRRQERKPPEPPESLLLGVGAGDYLETGRLTLSLLERLAGLRTSDRVLDVGCGLGRVAWPLSTRLGRQGSYTGFDVVKVYSDWCAESLDLDPERFRFLHVDVRTSLYNPDGSILAEDFAFPWPDGSFDLAIATSIFTHLLPRATENYLREIERTLSRRGRLFASFYMLDELGRRAAESGATHPAFLAPMEHGLLHDAAVPEAGVAYDAGWLLATVSSAGFEVASVQPGTWKGREGPYYQDLVVATRRR